MMNYIKKINISLIVIAILWAGLFVVQLGAPTPTSAWIDDAYQLKTHRAQQIDVPKLVVVSGSSALFGINSPMLEQFLNQPVVNFGVNAGLQLPYILNRSKKVLKQNDSVLLMLEYHHYHYTPIPSWVLIDYVSSRDPAYFHACGLKEKLQFVYGMPVSRLLLGLKQRLKPSEHHCRGVYCKENLNAYGDQINISPSDMTSLEKNTVNVERGHGEFSRISKYAKKHLQDYLDWAKANEIKVAIAAPNLIDYPCYHSNQNRKFFDEIKLVAQVMGVEFIGDPRHHLFEKKYSFNGGYHLNSDGVYLNTRRLIAELKHSQTFYAQCSLSNLAHAEHARAL